MLQNKLAWMLATCPDASVRNGAEAVAIARQLIQASRVPMLANNAGRRLCGNRSVPARRGHRGKGHGDGEIRRADASRREVKSQLDLYRRAALSPRSAAPDLIGGSLCLPSRRQWRPRRLPRRCSRRTSLTEYGG